MIASFGRRLAAFDRFTRIHFVGYTSVYALLGALSVRAEAPASFWLGLGAIGAAFHCYGAVLNDVVDLPVDRTQPARADDPLVKGTVSRGQALAFALLQLPIAFVLSAWLGGGAAAFGWLFAAALFMALYDVCGKRCPVPPLTDAAQGLCWASMACFGAALAGEAPNLLTACVAASGLVYTLLINGVHGGMRDLANDQAAGARTTALWLGMHPLASGIDVPRRAAWFCWPLQLGLLGLALLALAQPGPSALARLVSAALVLAAGAASVFGMWRVLRPDLPGWQSYFRVHLVVLLLPLFAALLPHAEWPIRAGILLLFFVPMLLLENPFRWLRRSAPSELLIAVDERGEALGALSRQSCHAGQGILHRAFSVYLFDPAGRLLLQRRSAYKQLWPLFWSNSCCSHPRWGEESDVAARRRVREELGVDVALQELFRFHYHAAYGSAGSERELCSVYVGRVSAPVQRNEQEIADLRFASVEEIDQAVAVRPEAYTPWFRLGWERLRRDHWAQVGSLQ